MKNARKCLSDSSVVTREPHHAELLPKPQSITSDLVIHNHRKQEEQQLICSNPQSYFLSKLEARVCLTLVKRFPNVEVLMILYIKRYALILLCCESTFYLHFSRLWQQELDTHTHNNNQTINSEESCVMSQTTEAIMDQMFHLKEPHWLS